MAGAGGATAGPGAGSGPRAGGALDSPTNLGREPPLWGRAARGDGGGGRGGGGPREPRVGAPPRLDECLTPRGVGDARFAAAAGALGEALLRAGVGGLPGAETCLAVARQALAGKGAGVRLAAALPLAAAALPTAGQGHWGQDAAGGTLGEYLELMGDLGEMHELARQVGLDAREISCHKFVPHQLARLYKYCNRIHGDLRPFRRRIEENFEEIQAQADRGECLSEAQMTWLSSLASDIQAALSTVPPSVRRRVAPVAGPLLPSQ